MSPADRKGKKHNMNTRERFLKVLNFERPDRLPVIEWATWWQATLERWAEEGIPAGLDGVGLMEYFGLDRMVQCWFCPRGPGFPAPSHRGAGVVADAGEYERLRRNGALHNLDTVDWSIFDRYRREHDEGDAVFWFTLEGFFWFPRTLFGIEGHLFSFYDSPELLKRMNQDQTDFSLRILERLLKEYPIEFMTFAEDMSYNHGAMISEELFDEFMLPYYRQVIPLLKEHGVKVFVDSDGDVSECIGWFRRAGVEGILPLERQAGVDVAALRERYPDFLFMGGYDKTVMHRGESAVRNEFERLLPTARQGGFFVSCDHQTPPEVSLNDYRLYLKLFREYAGKAVEA